METIEASPATFRATPNALPDAWIAKLFRRFLFMYGNEWSNKWTGLRVEEVQALWAQDLAFASAEEIRLALAHASVHCARPPSLPEFVGICRSFGRVMEAPRSLPNAKRAELPPEWRTEIAKLFDPSRKRDCKEWAREILTLHAQGKYRHLIGIINAERALGLRHD